MMINGARRRAWVRAAVVAVVAGVACLVAAGTAWAHVETVPDRAVKGAVAVVTFRVPNEESDAGTVKVRLDLPADHPLPLVRARSTSGWSVQIVKATLDKPVRAGNVELTEAYRSITWTAAAGTRIGPGEFAEFAVSLGPMPEDTDRLVITAVQTYDNGETVSWDQPPTGGAEPEHPAPVIMLTAQDTSTSAAAPGSSGSTGLWLGGVGLGVAALALGIAVGTALRTRRTHTTS